MTLDTRNENFCVLTQHLQTHVEIVAYLKTGHGQFFRDPEFILTNCCVIRLCIFQANEIILK
jgi:hypothetical protein